MCWSKRGPSLWKSGAALNFCPGVAVASCIMGERRISEIFDSPFLPELVAAHDRASLLEPDRANVATAVLRLAQCEDRRERYNEGINALATILAWLDAERPSDACLVHHEGLCELRKMVRDAA